MKRHIHSNDESNLFSRFEKEFKHYTTDLEGRRIFSITTAILSSILLSGSGMIVLTFVLQYIEFQNIYAILKNLILNESEGSFVSSLFQLPFTAPELYIYYWLFKFAFQRQTEVYCTTYKHIFFMKVFKALDIEGNVKKSNILHLSESCEECSFFPSKIEIEGDDHFEGYIKTSEFQFTEITVTSLNSNVEINKSPIYFWNFKGVFLTSQLRNDFPQNENLRIEAIPTLMTIIYETIIRILLILLFLSILYSRDVLPGFMLIVFSLFSLYLIRNLYNSLEIPEIKGKKIDPTDLSHETSFPKSLIASIHELFSFCDNKVQIQIKGNNIYLILQSEIDLFEPGYLFSVKSSNELKNDFLIVKKTFDVLREFDKYNSKLIPKDSIDN